MTKKYTNFFFSALLALCVITGCDDKDDDAPAMTVSSNSVTIPATGGEESIEITTNQSEWSATRPELDSWCTLKTNGNALKISASANETITPRSTMVTVTAGVGSNAKTQEITVTQKAAAPSLEITGTPVHLDAAGTAIELTVTTNTGIWNASHPDGDTWCILSQEGDKLTVSAEAYTVNAERKTTVTVTYGEDASLTPKTFEVTQQGAAPVYAIEIPSDFSTGDVQKVMYQNVKVAEVCREYIKTDNTDKQMVVIYPMTEEGKTDLTKGFAIEDGGSIVWNTENNTCTYTPGTASALSKIYLASGNFSTTTTASSITTNVEADLLTDTRPNDTKFNYKIVKIGTQYWMAENLKAQSYLDGTEIPRVTDGKEWDANTTGAYKIPFSDTQTFLTHGAYYNGYTMYNEAGLAPEGWIVPSDDEWNKLRNYIKTPYGTKLKSSSVSHWNNKTGTNITGFNVLSSGYYSSATGDTGSGTDVYYWSTTKTKDWLTREEVPHYYRLANTSTGMPTDTHSPNFGHCIRCVRK